MGRSSPHRPPRASCPCRRSAVLSIPLLLLAALVAERNRSARELDERLKFEQLVSEVSASLINPPPAKADEEVEKALHKTAIALALDRCSVFQYHPEQRSCRITHSAESADCPPVRREIAEAELPWLLRQLQAGVTVVLNEVVRDLPAEAIAERQYAEGYGSRSWLAVPVTVGDDVVRAVSFHSIRQRDWSAELVSRLQLLAEIFVSSVGSLQAEGGAARERGALPRCRRGPDRADLPLPPRRDVYVRQRRLLPLLPTLAGGAPRAQLLGLIPPEDHQAARAFLASITRDRPVATRRARGPAPGRRRPLATMARPRDLRRSTAASWSTRGSAATSPSASTPRTRCKAWPMRHGSR